MILLIGSVYAIKNPSAVYCEEMGYKFIINSTEEGEVGICKLPDSTSVKAWDFLRGKVAKEYSYCEKQGYVLKTIEDGEKCSSIYSYNCAVCVIEIKEEKITGLASSNFDEVEVTRLMNLSFNEGVCGDSVCIIEESHGTCPEDCPSGQRDGYCDEVKENICDPDCTKGEDPDCPDVIESKCIYDGICSEECLGTDDLDCLCIDVKSEECKLALDKFGKEELQETYSSKELSKKEGYTIYFLISLLIISILVASIILITKLVKKKKTMKQ